MGEGSSGGETFSIDRGFGQIQKSESCGIRGKVVPTAHIFQLVNNFQQYNHVANQNKAANAIAYKQWVESHTPEQIRLANNARTQLRTKDPLHTWKPIHDDRRPKRPSTPMVFFAKERYASGDLKGIPLGDNSRLVSREWAALSPSDRKVGNPYSWIAVCY
jgi:hypothetical protein